jgi:hypothetical protein
MSTKEFASQLSAEIVAAKSYSLWKDSAFRDQNNFKKISNKLQDKIFNELQVTALLYVMFFLEEKGEEVKNRHAVVYSNIAEYMERAFIELMADVEISSAHLSLWEKLIKKRADEYRKDMKFVRKESNNWDVFEGEDKFLRETWVRIITLSLATTKLIKKDTKTTMKDPVWKTIRRWLISIEVELNETFKETDLKTLKVLN